MTVLPSARRKTTREMRGYNKWSGNKFTRRKTTREMRECNK
jgi:hypothetical protein